MLQLVKEKKRRIGYSAISIPYYFLGRREERIIMFLHSPISQQEEIRKLVEQSARGYSLYPLIYQQDDGYYVIASADLPFVDRLDKQELMAKIVEAELLKSELLKKLSPFPSDTNQYLSAYYAISQETAGKILASLESKYRVENFEPRKILEVLAKLYS